MESNRARSITASNAADATVVEQVHPEPATQKPPVALPASELVPGCRVGRYVVLEKLGEGGMGVVYAGYDPELHRKVAIKLLHAGSDGSLGSVSSLTSGQERLLREAQALAQLSHPNVVAVHDVGTFESSVFMAMEFIEGQDLRQWLAEERRAPKDVVRVFLEAGRGLAAAHDKGLVHRDFKPANVLLSREGRVYVLDFGLARASEDPGGALSVRIDAVGASASHKLLDTPLTQAGYIVGTGPYMAPELFWGSPADVRSDIFAFAVALHEALYGERPFAKVGVWKVSPPPANRKVPLWLRRVLLTGLALAPEDRPASMHAFLGALANDPAPKRRQRWLTAGALLVVTGTAMGAQQALLDRPRPCRGEEDSSREVWNSDVEAQLRGTLLASGKSHAAATLDRVVPALDGYAVALASARREACMDTRVRGTATEEVFGLKLECFDRRRTELHALVDVLSSPAEGVIDQAVQAVHQLAPVQACDDIEALRAPIRPPENPETRARVEDLREKLAHAQALLHAGQYAAALTAAEAVVAVVDEIGYAPLEAEAGLIAARSLDELGRFEDSDRLYRRSLMSAIAGKHHRLAAQLGTLLVWVTYFRGKHEETPLWTDFTRASLEASGGDDAIEARFAMALGAIADTEGRREDAARMFERGLELAKRRPEAPQLATAHSNLGICLSALHRYAEAVSHIEQSIALSEKLYGPEHPTVAVGYGTLGNTLVLWKGPVPEAEEKLRHALALRVEFFGTRHWRVGETLFQLAQLHGERGEYSTALELILQAIDPSDAINHADHQINAGSSLRSLGRLPEALERQELALQLLEKAPEPLLGEIAAARFEIALTLDAMGRTSEAWSLLERAFAEWNEAGETDTFMVLEATETHGVWLLRTGQTAQALQELGRALTLTENNVGPEHRDVARRLLRLGEAQLAARDVKAALASFERALPILESAPLAPELLGEARFLLAQALTGARRDEPSEATRARVQALVGQALEDFGRSEHAERDRMLSRIRAWSRDHATD